MNNIVEHITNKTTLSSQEAWWLVEWATDKTKASIIAQGYELTHDEQKKINVALTKINNDKMPIAYVIGWVPFGDLKLTVRPPVLIPRPETEEWVHHLITQLKPHETKINRILDIGTGSGCIALTLAQAFPNAKVTATDINPQALALAKENAQQNNIQNVHFIESDLFTNISETFDLIVSNPPYIAEHYESGLDQSVTQWEDHEALFTSDNGLALIKQMIDQLNRFLTKKDLPICAAFECDPEQVEPIINYAQEYNFIGESFTDHFNHERSVFLRQRS